MSKKMNIFYRTLIIFLLLINFCNAKELRVIVPDMPVFKGNPFTGLGSPTIYTWSALFDALTWVDKEGSVKPSLATKWVNIDPNTWRFHLRPNVIFHNKEPFNSKAVLTTINWLKSKPGKITTTGKDIDAIIESAKIISPHIIEIRTYNPDAILPANISEMHIPAPNSWTELGAEKFALSPSGTGPFKIINWTENGVKMNVFYESWRPSKNIKYLTIFEVPERIGRVQALLSNQTDIAIGLAYDDIEIIENAGYKTMLEPAPLVSALQFVSIRPNEPFSDKRVRIAANLAVNRNLIAQTILKNIAIPANQPAANHSYGFNPQIKDYPFDPHRAKILLNEAGYPNGFKGRMEVAIEATVPAALETQIQVASDLRKIGIKLDVIPIQFASWLRKWYGGPLSKSVDFPEMFSLNIVLGPQLDVGRIFRTHSCEKKINGYFGFYCDPEIMPLIRASRREFNPQKRKKILHKIMDNYNSNPSAIYLFTLKDVTGLNSKIYGLTNTNRNYSYEKVLIK